MNGFQGRLLQLVRMGDTDERVVVAYGYRVAGYWRVNPIAVKALQGIGVLLGDRGAGLVAVSAACQAGCQSARRAVIDFIRVAQPLTRWLPDD
jgi:hypothetical protein